MIADEIIDAEEAAILLRCKPGTAEALMRDGKLGGTKIGRSWITTRAEVVAFVVERIRTERRRPDGMRAEIVAPTRGRRRAAPPTLPDVSR